MRRAVLATVLASVLGLAALAAVGCGGGETAATTSATPAAESAGCPTTPVPVVVSVDQWGDIVEQLAGECGNVTTIITSSSVDPHDYEPTSGDGAEFTGARLVVVNGLDYDPWADRFVDTLDPRPAVVDAGEVVGLEEGDNPHVWYGPGYVTQVSDAVTAELTKLAPNAADYFAERRAAWDVALRPYEAQIATAKEVGEGRSYGATESVFDYMADAVGLENATPQGYRQASANETDPSPGDLNELQTLLEAGEMDVLVYNTQTEGPIPEQIRATAEGASVPVVEVTESVPPGVASFVEWQVGQLTSLVTALGGPG